MKLPLVLSLAVAAIAAPVQADPPPQDKPLPGERIGGAGQDLRAGMRLETRLPTRLETRISPRTIGDPLVAATSQITADRDNGCARTADAKAAQLCRRPQ